MITIREYLSPQSAEILLGRLTALGIPAFLLNKELARNGSFGDLRGVHLVVPDTFATEAQAILSAIEHGEMELKPEDDVGASSD
jgi:hypothetical protein